MSDKMNFNIAGGARDLYGNDIENQLGGIFNTANHKRVIESFSDEELSVTEKYDKQYDSNYDYWIDVMGRKIHQNFTVKLSGFHILEWLPQFPGLIHKEDSISRLKEAFEYGKKRWVNNLMEFEPDEKGIFMNSGYGSMRFGTKVVRGKEYYLLCATSSGTSHEGIPLVLDERLYREVIGELKNAYGVCADIIAQIRLIPNTENPILRWKNIPSYYLFVKKIHLKRLSKKGETMVSVAVSYNADKTVPGNYKWSFKQFYPDAKDENLFDSVCWLRNYAQRYEQAESPYIIGDFDEFIPHFDSPDFDIIKVSNDLISQSKIKKYKEEFHLDINESLSYNSDIFILNDLVYREMGSMLSNNRAMDCITYLSEQSVNEKLSNYLILIRSRLVTIDELRRKGTITMEEYLVYKNRITDALLNAFKSS